MNVNSDPPAPWPDPPSPGGKDGAFCARILKRAREAIVVQTVDGRVEWMNPAAERMFGWRLSQVRGKRGIALVQPERDQTGSSFCYDLKSRIFERYQVSRHRRRDGSLFWNQQSFTVLGHDEANRRIVITCRDVTEQVMTEQALRTAQVDLQNAAFHDDLTGLANRARLNAYLTSDLVQRQIARGETGILQVDVDKFKEINDTFGHAAGDATLRHVADALRGAAGPRDLVCRTGGDEFLMVCHQATTPEALMRRADLVLQQVTKPLSWAEQTIRIGASVGACLANGEPWSGETLIQHADQALYAAKNRGRGRVVLYTDDLGRAQTLQNQLARDLRTAIAEDQLEVHLQPQLHLGLGRITGVEALLRWNHPTRGQLPPGAFLDTARSTGLLADLDYRSMMLALDALTHIRASGFSDMCMSINVSAEILADVNYPGLLDWALQSRGLPARCICVEILETTILNGQGCDVMGAVDRLKRLGARVALDDFGTGYAGLAHMSSIDIDAIKLDRSMIARLHDDPRNRIIIRAIIRLCGLLNMKVVAEGVETAAQLDILRKAKCPLIQGFGLARPMAVSDALAWLKANAPMPHPLAFPPVTDAPGNTSPLPRAGHV